MEEVTLIRSNNKYCILTHIVDKAPHNRSIFLQDCFFSLAKITRLQTCVHLSEGLFVGFCDRNLNHSECKRFIHNLKAVLHRDSGNMNQL